MRVTFVKTPGQHDRFYVQRADGSEASWSFTSYGPRRLPHDLVHFVVESEMGFVQGLWGRVADGADLAQVNAEANRAGGAVAEKYRALGADLSELILAEAFAGTDWLAEWMEDAERHQSLLSAYASLGRPPPEGFDVARVTALREAVSAAQSRWSELGPKGSMTLMWSA